MLLSLVIYLLLLFVVQANDANSEEPGNSLSKASKGCSAGAIVAIVVEWIIIFIIIGVTVNSAAKATDTGVYTYNNRYNNYNNYN